MCYLSVMKSSPACYSEVQGSIEAFLSPNYQTGQDSPAEIETTFCTVAHIVSHRPLNRQHSNIVSTEPELCVLPRCVSIVAGKVCFFLGGGVF